MTLHNRSVPKEHCLETSKWCGNIKAAIQCERKSESRRMTQTEKKEKMFPYQTDTHFTQDSFVQSQVDKYYLECHFAHKNGSKDVVGDG